MRISTQNKHLLRRLRRISRGFAAPCEVILSLNGRNLKILHARASIPDDSEGEDAPDFDNEELHKPDKLGWRRGFL